VCRDQPCGCLLADAAVAALATLPAGIANALRHGEEYLQAMRTVVPVCTSVPYQITPSRPPDEALLQQLAVTHGVEGPAQRLLAALRAKAAP
jgi:hypothetical protein